MRVQKYAEKIIWVNHSGIQKRKGKKKECQLLLFFNLKYKLNLNLLYVLKNNL